MSTKETELYGQHPVHSALQSADSPYESPEEYADQGDTRVVRDLLFSYLANTGEDAAGNLILQPVDIPRDREVTVDQIGLLGLKKGEDNHSFYTTEELRQRETGGAATATAPVTDISEAGEYELAEWIQNEKPTINEVLERVGDDKELAHRMLQAENIATGGEPRKGLEEALRLVIQEA